MHSDLSRTIPHKPILFIDFDQTMINGDNMIKKIVVALYQIELIHGVSQQQVDSIAKKTRSE